MRLTGRKALFRRQAGFTLVELLVVIALMGIISLGAAISTGQLLNQTSRDSHYVMAGHNAANAAYWIGRDALMAQRVSGWQTFPATTALTLSWTEWDNSTHSANYTVANGVLTRVYSNGSSVARTVIAEDISTVADKTYCSLSTDNMTLSLTVTSSVGGGDRAMEVTQIRSITCRPKL